MAFGNKPLLLAVTTLVFIAGCDETLETGYKPRRLNATDAERRAYYAPEFTPESQGGKNGDHRPPPDLSTPQ